MDELMIYINKAWDFLHSKKSGWHRGFAVAFIVFAAVSIFALRANNEAMISLRNQVYAADKSGGDVNAALNKLRAYVYGHMNTNLSSGSTIYPPIQLQYTYQRLETQAQAAANNSQLYTQAEDYCQAQIPANVSISGRGRISCITNYITAHGGQSPAAIPVSLYEYDFLSPTWSPDLAGWSLVIAGIALIGFAASFIHHHLKRK